MLIANTVIIKIGILFLEILHINSAPKNAVKGALSFISLYFIFFSGTNKLEVNNGNIPHTR